MVLCARRWIEAMANYLKERPLQDIAAMRFRVSICQHLIRLGLEWDEGFAKILFVKISY